MATYTVSTSGNDGNAGTVGSPWRNPDVGLSRCSAGDTLQLRSGTYNNAIIDPTVSGTAGNYINVINFAGETVTLRPTGGQVAPLSFINNCRYISFDGINLDASAGVTNFAIVIRGAPSGNSDHLRFRNMTITGVVNGTPNEGLFSEQNVYLAGATGSNEFYNVTISGGGDSGDSCYGMYISSPSNIVDSCNIFNVASQGIQIYDGSGSYAPNFNIIRNCRIHDITRTGDNRIRGIIVLGNSNLLYNNRFYNFASTDFVRGIDISSGSGNLVYSNGVYNSAQHGMLIRAEASGTVVRNNAFYGNGTNYENLGSGTSAGNNITNGTNPGWVAPGSGDFTVLAGAAVIDGGATLGSVTINGSSISLATDYAGTARPQGVGYDIGPFEFVGGGGPVDPPPDGGAPALRRHGRFHNKA